ncbi:glycosyltransferase 87 family protein [Actinokineospora pegani]|uniref:glycosyltransferase 87 family protein n=1 Tax=Actinokineospora pegani TaxID=2654637 RepID=UPI0012EA18D2|nr:glycosyltransferase 87 family protein [Actinokineospora pegani]
MAWVSRLRRIPPVRRDVACYVVFAAFALGTALGSEFYGYRVWGNFATAGYAAAALAALAIAVTGRGSRWVPVTLAWVSSTLVPVGVLAVVRSPGFTWGPWPWSFPAQPEVWVIERSARALLAEGSPYLDLDTLGRAPHPDDYTPYGPSMTLFGFPRALFGDHPLTDSRVAFLVVSVAALAVAWRVLGRPRVPVGAAILVAAGPPTALTLSVAGDDVAVVALVVLAAALAYRAAPTWAGLLCAVLVTMKLTAVPVAAVLAFGVAARLGKRGLAVFLGSLALGACAISVPVLVVDPRSFVEHVINFPIGLGRAGSPASSPLPGHLIAGLGPIGHTVALVVLLTAAGAVTAWLLVRPPRTAADALVRAATGLGAAILLAPATRWGYLVYPVMLLGAALAFAAAERRAARAELPGNTGRLPGSTERPGAVPSPPRPSGWSDQPKRPARAVGAPR